MNTCERVLSRIFWLLVSMFDSQKEPEKVNYDKSLALCVTFFDHECKGISKNSGANPWNEDPAADSEKHFTNNDNGLKNSKNQCE